MKQGVQQTLQVKMQMGKNYLQDKNRLTGWLWYILYMAVFTNKVLQHA